MEKTPKKLGRPSTYSPEVVAPILERISAGETLTAICREEGQPSLWTIYGWLGRNEDFAQAYARAQAERAETLADEITALCDELPDRGGADGKVDSGWVQWQRNRIDARKWLASKLLPKKYGERVQAELTGKDGGPLKVLRVSGEEADL